MIFAQAAAGPGGIPPNAAPWIAGMLGCIAFVLVIALLIAIFFLRTLSRALDRCHPDNRSMSPGQVWLNLIPCFNVVWQFVTVIRVGDSLKTEFADRRLDEGDTDYGKTIGLTWLILGIVGGFVQNVPQAAAPNAQGVAVIGAGLGGILGLAQLVLFVMYWVRIAGYSRQLADDDEDRYGRDDEQDDPDDRPRRRRRPPADEEESDDDRR